MAPIAKLQVKDSSPSEANSSALQSGVAYAITASSWPSPRRKPSSHRRLPKASGTIPTAAPEELTPQFDVHCSERLPWMEIADGLPRFAHSSVGAEQQEDI